MVYGEAVILTIILLLLCFTVSVIMFPIVYKIPMMWDYISESIIGFLRICKKYIESRVRDGK